MEKIIEFYNKKALFIDNWFMDFINNTLLKGILNPENIFNPMYFSIISLIFAFILILALGKITINEKIKIIFFTFIVSIPLTFLIGLFIFIIILIIGILIWLLFWSSYVLIFASPFLVGLIIIKLIKNNSLKINL